MKIEKLLKETKNTINILFNYHNEPIEAPKLSKAHAYFYEMPQSLVKNNLFVTWYDADSIWIKINLNEDGKRLSWQHQILSALQSVEANHEQKIGVWLPEQVNQNLADALVMALLLWQTPIFNQKTNNSKPIFVDTIEVLPFANWHFVLEKALILAKIQIQVMDWVNKPANFKTPELLGNWFVNEASKLGATTQLLGENALNELGMRTLLAVGQGSRHQTFLGIGHYKHKDAKITIGLVGKGITFDTGGVSLKSSTNMHFQKNDMGGAAGLMGAFLAIAALKLPIEVVALFPMAENIIDQKSILPGDIIKSFSGKTIEVLDTDAEGRLVLADALSYILSEHKLDYVVDMATLTGSAFTTFGTQAGALFCTSTEMANDLICAGIDAGERVWQLPLWEEYASDLKSDVADLRNFPGRPVAGAIVAAKFLQEFTNKHPNWAHIDMAGMSFQDSKFHSMKVATGYGMRLITTWVEHLLTKK